MSVVLSQTAHQRTLPPLHPYMSAREVLAIAFRNRGKILLGLVVPPIIAVALAFLLQPVYRAQSDVLVKTGREYLASGEADAAQSAPQSTKQEGINSEIELLTSRPVVDATIRMIGIDKLYPSMLESPPPGSIQDLAIERFSSQLSVEPVKMSNIVSVSFDAGSPEQAEMVLNMLLKIYIAKHTEVFADKRTEGYDEAIKSLLAEMSRLESKRTKIKLDNEVYDIAGQRSALITQRVEAQSHLQDITNNQASLTARIAYLSHALPAIPRTAATVTTQKSDDAVHSLTAITDLRQTEASLSSRYSDSNPDLQRVRAQIAALQHAMPAVSRSDTSSAPSPLRQRVEQELVMSNAELQPLQAEIDRTQAVIARFDAELQRIEQADLDLRTTGVRLDALNDNLKAIQVRYEQARTREQTELAHQVSVVQVAPAMAPHKPAKPKKSLFAAGGVLLGLLAAGGVLLFSVLTNKTLLTEEAAERLVGLPVLLTLPMVKLRAGAVRLEIE